MSAIFISHSSRDNEVSAEIRRRLLEQGHRSIFLDFDPADGIPAGRSWEQELYAQLRACQAIIVLCSEHSMASDWCFAEITHAKSLGKHVFPIKVGPCEIRPLLTEFQVLDWTADPEDTCRRLWRGLEIAGLDPKNIFDWDGDRPPYPGLLAFQAEDAAIFFGRNDEIRRGLALLRRLERFGGTRWTLVLGASGSGKSSLVRAGILPRLERDHEAWLPLSPFRPLDRPFEELAKTLAAAFEHHGAPRNPQDLQRQLHPSTGRPNSQALIELANELRLLADRPRATLLLPIDQLEELLAPKSQVKTSHVENQSGENSAPECARFLAFLRTALETPHSPLRVLATLRSDFLGSFQGHHELRELSFESLTVGPMSVDGYAQIIEGPAQLAGIELETGLVQAMVDDTETEDALPLLAFALRELWEGFGKDGRLETAEYREQLGGLSGAVALAAETALTAGQTLSAAQEADLQTAFVAMVRINDEGKYARRPVLWSEMPESVREVLERFVDARLLVAHGDGRTSHLEVAHEALLRSWDRLVAWLDENRAFLMWRQRIEEARREWERTERHPQTLLQGPALAEAAGWSEKRRDLLSREEQAFIGHSLSARRRRQRRRSGLIGLAILSLAIFAAWSHLQKTITEKVMMVAHDRSVLNHSRSLRASHPGVASRALLDLHNPELYLMSLDLDSLAEAGRLLGKSDDGILIAIDTADATAPTDATPTSDQPTTKPPATEPKTTEQTGQSSNVDIKLLFDTRWNTSLPHDKPVYLIAIEGSRGAGLLGELRSRRGRRVLTASEDLVVRLWELPEIETIVTAMRDAKIPGTELIQHNQEPKLLAEFDGHPHLISVIEISPDGAYAATACQDEIGLWRTTSGAEPVLLGGHRGDITSASFDPKSRLLLTTSRDNTARIWQLTDLFAAPQVLTGHRTPLISGAFDLATKRILTLSEDGEVWLWSIETGQGAKVASSNCNGLEVAFADEQNSAILACTDGTARIFEVDDGEMRLLE